MQKKNCIRPYPSLSPAHLDQSVLSVGMRITDEQLQIYIALVFKNKGISLNHEQAYDELQRLAHFAALMVLPSEIIDKLDVEKAKEYNAGV